MPADMDALIRAAHASRESAYAPYSKFLVGAAITLTTAAALLPGAFESQ
jgi:cytidine deaminase